VLEVSDRQQECGAEQAAPEDQRPEVDGIRRVKNPAVL
jgi:hypothetical protein